MTVAETIAEIAEWKEPERIDLLFALLARSGWNAPPLEGGLAVVAIASEQPIPPEVLTTISTTAYSATTYTRLVICEPSYEKIVRCRVPVTPPRSTTTGMWWWKKRVDEAATFEERFTRSAHTCPRSAWEISAAFNGAENLFPTAKMPLTGDQFAPDGPHLLDIRLRPGIPICFRVMHHYQDAIPFRALLVGKRADATAKRKR